MSTQIRTDDAISQVEASTLISDTSTIPLTEADQAEVEETFKEAKDFRDL